MPLQIAHITDLHLDEEYPFDNKNESRNRFDYILTDIRKQGIEKIICTGDIAQGDGIEYFFNQLKDVPLSITLGNHDRFTEISEYLPLGTSCSIQKLYRSDDVESVKLIFLDSSEGFIDNNQLLWLESEIKSLKPIIIFIHHPVLGLPLKVDEIGRLKNRKELVSILKTCKNKVDIYCGHYHMESTLEYENLTQHITPAVAFQIQKHAKTIEIDTSISGYRIIEIEKDRNSSQVRLLKHAD
ncbi:metallophosphoesterase family protein [Roseivirga sp.]|uniref:metallophosphoesterase family protein n=1 Tax=Roseivirga sp. TaxID=1964215 RepID=UPI003B8C925F